MLAAAVVVVVLASPEPAAACECVMSTAARDFAGADAVYVAVAGPKKNRGHGWTQRVQIVETLKGASRRVFVWRRRGPSPCDPFFKSGETTILFATKGELDLCAGNHGIDSRRDDLAAIMRLAASPARRTRPTSRALLAAIEAGTAGYRHKRKRIEVRVGDGSLASSRRLGPTAIEIVQHEADNQIVIDDIAAAGKLTAVHGRYEREGLSFTILLAERSGHRTLKSGKHVPLAPRVIKAWQAEK
jgi:hypothetical protein